MHDRAEYGHTCTPTREATTKTPPAPPLPMVPITKQSPPAAAAKAWEGQEEKEEEVECLYRGWQGHQGGGREGALGEARQRLLLSRQRKNSSSVRYDYCSIARLVLSYLRSTNSNTTL